MTRPAAPAPPPRRSVVGLVVNPVAGVGGRVGLKGSDGADVQRRAAALGATPQAGARTVRALRRLAAGGDVELVVAPGAMGADAAAEAGLTATVLPGGASAPTHAGHTRRAAAALVDRGVDLLLFAGGDGTACDVHDAVGRAVPVLGVPTGVKMHSGVFAASPDAAGDAAAAWLAAADRPVAEAEVADIDEDALRRGRVATRLHGALCVPRDRGRVLAAKGSPARSSAAELDGAVARVVADVPPGAALLVGPGTTAARALAGQDLPATLLGVDAVVDGRPAGLDLDERGLLALLDRVGAAVLLLGVVGGQGALLGRGNQQLSPAVLRRVGRDGLRVVAAREKLAALSPAPLRVDTGDPALDRALAGHLPVRVSARETVVMPVSP